jgi:hypothetical protein
MQEENDAMAGGEEEAGGGEDMKKRKGKKMGVKGPSTLAFLASVVLSAIAPRIGRNRGRGRGGQALTTSDERVGGSPISRPKGWRVPF